MVRVFVPGADGETPMAGVVEHVGTSWSSRFGSDDELLVTLRSWLERERVPAVVDWASSGDSKSEEE